MAPKQSLEAQNPLILRCNRLIEAFAKSDDERDFFLDRREGFIILVDLDKPEDELDRLDKELKKDSERYCLIPKMTFYETKKIMEGFINEKVYDIDTKEKLLDIIQFKDARENFLEFIYDHHAELEKWQTFYQERSRIRIIEWLRANHFHFVFEEDLELPSTILEKLKRERFQTKASKDVIAARKVLITKSKSYYSNEALNPRPKRGRPPKQTLKVEFEPQVISDIYITIPNELRGFLFIPERHTKATSLASKFGFEDDLFSSNTVTSDNDLSMDSINLKLAALRTISQKWVDPEPVKQQASHLLNGMNDEIDFSIDDDDEDNFDEEDEDDFKSTSRSKKAKIAPTKSKKVTVSSQKTTNKIPLRKAKTTAKIVSKPKPKKTPPPKIVKKAPVKTVPNKKAKPIKTLRPMMKLKKKR